ncbi:FecR family protein [Niastella yeongjuensis]|uniref:FecR family protein n=1 Tax=Niastella yeongjuensis TaxID=354355 RepID=UPI0008AE29F6|nr:FecR family protein [Niastella yeongjuensis]SEO16082.1 FecR family protein [Niastella yeongjuensis]
MSDFITLFRKYAEGSCTDNEKQELFTLIALSENDSMLHDELDLLINTMDEDLAVPNEKANEILSVILRLKPGKAKTKRLFPFVWQAAAAILLLLGSGLYFLLTRPAATNTTQLAVVKEITPAANGAILTLDNGRTILLDSMQQNVIYQSGSTIKLNKGVVTYEANTSGTASYNTLTTPKGRIFHLVLPDSSDVWLNAGSSIRYPTAFTGAERKVELQGEAYFEVAHNAHKPFIVSKGSTTVQVLGTHFNVNAYDDEEAIKTTLLEGSVKVVLSAGRNPQSAILKPGQQAIAIGSPVTTAHSLLTINNSPDLDQVIAWRKGIFNFENADLKAVMRQLERWYDIQVAYENNVPNIVFGGKMKRDLNLSQVLRILEISKVNFRLEDRKLIVSSQLSN